MQNAEDIAFAGLSPPSPSLSMHTTHVALVAGRLRAGYFGLSDADALPSVFLTTAQSGQTLSSLGRLPPSAVHSSSFKVFSNTPLSNASLEALFSEM